MREARGSRLTLVWGLGPWGPVVGAGADPASAGPPKEEKGASFNDEFPPFHVVLHVFLVASGDMQTVWFPVPVTALFRRIVNVVSAFSISHHYLHQSPADSDPSCPKPYSLRWTAWRRSKSRDVCRKSPVNYLDAYMDPPERSEAQDTSRPNAAPTDSYHSWTPDQIHLLINNPALYEPLRKPRYPIVLCHGECAVTEPGRGIDANAG